MPEKNSRQKHEQMIPVDREQFDDPVAWMCACMAAMDEVGRLRRESGQGLLTRADYARMVQEVWGARLRRVRLTRAVAPSTDFMDRLVREAGWVFRQEVASGTVGVFTFAIDVETLATPSEARLALELATRSRFDVEVLEDRPARLGEGEGPCVARPETGTRSYRHCLADRFGLGRIRPCRPGELRADAACNRLGLTLWRFGNLVELGVIAPGNRQEMPASAARRSGVAWTWTETELTGLSGL